MWTTHLWAVGLVSPSAYVWMYHIKSGEIRYHLFQVFVLALGGYLLTLLTIPLIKTKMPPILTGKDLCKKGTERGENAVPEAMGLVSGAAFVVCMIFGMTFLADTPDELIMFSAGLLSICFMMCLGFVDDVLDLPWRYKLILPPIASLPLLVNYSGATTIILPKPIRFLFAQHGISHSLVALVLDITPDGAVLELSVLYMLYMGLMAVFCTNAINIYAGINGLEAGQSLVIACAVLLQNTIQIARDHDGDNCHLFSAIFMIPFIATTLGLLRYNWYPSDVFVGDTFCYYAGMTFAVVGILGHFSKTLLLFFLPQLFNFLYSMPQLFKLIPCPRHRLPRYNPKTKLVECSRIPNDPQNRANRTLINLFLQLFGPMSEQNLCLMLLGFQVVCCAGAFVIRYHLSSYFYDYVV